MYIDTIKIPIKKPIPRDQNILDCWRVIPGWNFFVSSQRDLNIFSNIKNWRVIYYSLTKTLKRKVILFWCEGCWFEKLRSDFLTKTARKLSKRTQLYYIQVRINCSLLLIKLRIQLNRIADDELCGTPKINPILFCYLFVLEPLK